MHAYEWAVLRAVPRVERGEFVNVGVVVYAQLLDYLQASIHVDAGRLTALHDGVDVAAVERHLGAVQALCAGTEAAGANGRRPRGERFRWLVAPRSTVLQTSPVHTGLTGDPAAELARLMSVMVTPVADGS